LPLASVVPVRVVVELSGAVTKTETESFASGVEPSIEVTLRVYAVPVGPLVTDSEAVIVSDGVTSFQSQ
jgi:hypothetical protein